MGRLCSGNPSMGLCAGIGVLSSRQEHRDHGEVCTGAAAAREVLGAGSLLSGFPFPSPGTSTPHPCTAGGCSAEKPLAHTHCLRDGQAQHTKCITILQFTAPWHHQLRWNG